IHAHKDDLGHGGDSDSLRNGNSGRRIGCCVIGEATVHKQHKY
ncbi:hypothetical protein NPIL_551721, partial [Nephila pilipes]